MSAQFEWDREKARASRRKHGVDFSDAVGVFEDDLAITDPDKITAVDEQRYLTMGRGFTGQILVVAYTWRGSRIRVFSARVATRQERRQYLEKRR